MNRIRRNHLIRRVAGIAAGLAGALLACSTAAPAAFAYIVPPRGATAGPPPYLPATPTQAPHPVHSPMHAPPPMHTIVGGMPGWQIALIAVGAAILAAAVAVILDRARTARRHLTASGT